MAVAWLPFIKYSPAMLILVFPLAFRMTCYYYRGAYYKAFWADPVACAVGEPRNEYRGEAKWPLLDPEHPPLRPLLRAALHRPALDRRVKGFRSTIPTTGHAKFGIGVGSLVLLHQRRADRRLHARLPLVPPPGGRHPRHASRSPARKKAYDCVSCLNRHHPKWAWFSLVWVGFTDVYVRLCSMGVIHDLRIF